MPTSGYLHFDKAANSGGVAKHVVLVAVLDGLMDAKRARAESSFSPTSTLGRVATPCPLVTGAATKASTS